MSYQHPVTWNYLVEVLKPTALRQQLVAWARKAADHHARTPARRRARDDGTGQVGIFWAVPAPGGTQLVMEASSLPNAEL